MQNTHFKSLKVGLQVFYFPETKLMFDPESGEEVKGIEYIIIPCHCVPTRPVNRGDLQGVQEYNIYKISDIKKRIICPSREY
jgi:hypothetical protein